MLDILKRVNKKIVFIVLAIIFLIAIIYFAWYWYRVMQSVKWGKNVSLNSEFGLKLNERAYYKKDQIQIQFTKITDSPNDMGAQFSATDYKNNLSANFYLSPTVIPQTALFEFQIKISDINKENNTVKLKLFKE